MSAIVPGTSPVAAHAAPKPVVRIDVTLFNRTKGFENTPQFAPWMTTSRPNPGPIKTVHISNCMFNLTTGAHKLHKEFVKMKAGAYYYQPQTQLNDKEVICDDMKGAMTLNVGDDIITSHPLRSGSHPKLDGGCDRGDRRHQPRGVVRDDSVPDPCAPTATPRSPKRVRTSTMRVLQLEAGV